MNIKDITITSLETITAFDVVTGNYKFTLDELQNATIANTQDSTEITGKGGRKLANLKRNKAVTISGTNGLVSGGLLEAQTGGKFETKATDVMWTDYLTVAGGKASTLYKAVGTTGAEIEALYIRNADGSLSQELTQASAAATGKFAYAPASKAITFHTDVTDGTEVVVYYKRRIKADVLNNESDVYSEKCTLLSMLWAKTNVAMFTEFSSLFQRLTSLVNSLWKWVRIRQHMLSRLNLWQELVAQAALCGHTLCSG